MAAATTTATASHTLLIHLAKCNPITSIRLWFSRIFNIFLVASTGLPLHSLSLPPLGHLFASLLAVVAVYGNDKSIPAPRFALPAPNLTSALASSAASALPVARRQLASCITMTCEEAVLPMMMVVNHVLDAAAVEFSSFCHFNASM